MFFVRLLLFFAALYFSPVQADDFTKRISQDHHSFIKTDQVAPSPNNASRLATLVAIHKEKHSQHSSDDDLSEKPALAKKYHISISSPQLDHLQNIATKFKEFIKNRTGRNPLYLTLGCDDEIPVTKKLSEEEERALLDRHEMVGALGAGAWFAGTGAAATTAVTTTAVATTAAAAGTATVGTLIAGGTAAATFIPAAAAVAVTGTGVVTAGVLATGTAAIPVWAGFSTAGIASSIAAGTAVTATTTATISTTAIVTTVAAVGTVGTAAVIVDKMIADAAATKVAEEAAKKTAEIAATQAAKLKIAEAAEIAKQTAHENSLRAAAEKAAQQIRDEEIRAKSLRDLIEQEARDKKVFEDAEKLRMEVERIEKEKAETFLRKESLPENNELEGNDSNADNPDGEGSHNNDPDDEEKEQVLKLLTVGGMAISLGESLGNKTKDFFNYFSGKNNDQSPAIPFVHVNTNDDCSDSDNSSNLKNNNKLPKASKNTFIPQPSLKEVYDENHKKSPHPLSGHQPTDAPAPSYNDGWTWPWSRTVATPKNIKNEESINASAKMAEEVTKKSEETAAIQATELKEMQAAQAAKKIAHENSLRAAVEKAAQQIRDEEKRVKSLQDIIEQEAQNKKYLEDAETLKIETEKEKIKIERQEIRTACLEMKTTLAMLIAAGDADLKQLKIFIDDINCDDYQNDNQKKDPLSDNALYMKPAEFIAQQLVNKVIPQATLEYFLPGLENNPQNNFPKSCEKFTKDFQKRFQDQRNQNHIERIKAAYFQQVGIIIWQNSIAMMKRTGFTESDIQNIKFIDYRVGFYNDPKAQVLTVTDVFGCKQQFVIPAYKNAVPFRVNDLDMMPIPEQQQEKPFCSPLRDQDFRPESPQSNNQKKGPHQEKKEKEQQVDKSKDNQKPGFITRTLDYLLCRTPQKPASATPSKATAQEQQKPEQQGCGKPDPNAPVTPTHTGHGPQPVIEQDLPGCGKPHPDAPPRLTDTGHGPQPTLPQDLPGCGKPLPGLEGAQKPFMFADWIGSDGKTREEGDLSGLDPRFKDKNKDHIFDDRPGHLPDNPENRKRVKEVVTNPTKYLGPDKHGNWWYGEILPDGTQLWGEARGEEITNGGLNEIPKEYNPDSGLCDFDPSKQKKQQ